MTFRTPFPALALAAAFLGASAAQAAPDSLAVRYADLDTSGPAGAQALLGRIDQAALVVCGGRPDIRAIADLQRFQACHAEAREKAIAQVGQPLVAMLGGLRAGR
jgi:UrcA family protein